MSERIEKLVKELRMVSNMINMGEKIRWGQETFLMDRAADTLTQLEAERDEAVAEAIVNERERISKWASLSLKLNYGRANWVSYDNLLEAIAYPSDISSDNNNGS